jgi:hypothetical protein
MPLRQEEEEEEGNANWFRRMAAGEVDSPRTPKLLKIKERLGNHQSYVNAYFYSPSVAKTRVLCKMSPEPFPPLSPPTFPTCGRPPTTFG